MAVLSYTAQKSFQTVSRALPASLRAAYPRGRFAWPFLLLLTFFGSLALASTTPANPHYILKLTLNEYSVLNSAEVDGLLKYGGSGDFHLRMAKEGDEVCWNVTIDSPRLMELLGIFVGEKTVKLVQGMDPNNLDPGEKIALAAIKSLSRKLDYARANPVYDVLKLAGLVQSSGTNWLLKTDDESLLLTGPEAAGASAWANQRIVADGVIKVAGQFDITRVIEQRTNTLELFVMSLCPYGQRAESKLYAFIESTNCPLKPRLEIHYLFYKKVQDGKETFFSLHGEEEITENLVQIILRDSYPALFEPYVRLRAGGSTEPWTRLLTRLGFTQIQLDQISGSLKTRREELIQSEYLYATTRYGVTDGSPTYIWESQRAADLTRLEKFKGLRDFSAEACNQ
jgi:hypothetical protein